MYPLMDAMRTIDAVDSLRAELGQVDLTLEVPGAVTARSTAGELAGQIDDYLLPRLRQIDAPLLAVVGGSTGAGKSALVNSLVGREVSPSGVLRPTTTRPVLVTNPADIGWFEDDRVLPRLARSTGSKSAEGSSLELVVDDDVPVGLALLDAPDIDSIVEANRELAVQLLAAADLWLFVTTASRYADAVPWEFLQRARRRSIALALVLNRLPREALEEVPEHLRSMLAENGLADAPLLTVPETDLEGGLIPAATVAPVKRWLDHLAVDAHERATVIRRTLAGVIASLDDRANVIATHVESATKVGEELASYARQAYDLAMREVEDGLSGGPLLRSEVLARWHEFIGTGDFMRSLQGAIGRFRDRIGDVLLGRPPVEAEVRSEVERNVESVLTAAADKALERTIESWRANPAGRALVEGPDTPHSSSKELRDRIDEQVRAWQATVLEMVSAEGADKRTAGRAVAFGINAVGSALMIAVFAHTGGLSGGEVVVAGGTATLSQRVLEALFGDQAVRTLTARARTDLLERLKGLLQTEENRWQEVLETATPAPEQADRLRSAARAVQAAAS